MKEERGSTVLLSVSKEWFDNVDITDMRLMRVDKIPDSDNIYTLFFDVLDDRIASEDERRKYLRDVYSAPTATEVFEKYWKVSDD